MQGKKVFARYYKEMVCSSGANVGSYSPIPWTPYKQANAKELRKMFEYALPAAEHKNKKFIFTAFGMDVLRKDTDDIAKEEFGEEHMEKINWERFGVYKDVRGKI